MKKWTNTPKRKEATCETQLELENELKKIKVSLTSELDKNRHLQEDLKKVKVELDKSLHWTWYFNEIASMYKSDSLMKLPLCTRVMVVAGKGLAKVRGGSQKWYIDSDCSKHMTGRMDDFLSLNAFQGGSVSFGNDKKGHILGIGKIGKTLSHAIENVYYVNVESPKDTEEPGPSIIPLKAEHRVADAVKAEHQMADAVSGTSEDDQRSRIHASIDVSDGSNTEGPGLLNPEVQLSN
ncbi:uncharacterized protein LOC132628750 [Lycium barbarum]|uniref:uncharacterized protein LOC132628750 n=1 Tax=Lycium barbarum TaxID=112863 RepID=UPI00293F35C5|nr:uncharacterized protein LOC132628750 [Lycium barbarum]